MNKHSSSRQSVVLVAVLGAAVVGALVFAWIAKPAEPRMRSDIGAPLPSPPPNPVAPPSGEPMIDEESYGQALFEITCVRAKIADPQLQQISIDEIYRRYEWDEQSFDRATAIMKDNPETIAALTARMNECTTELAESFSPQHRPSTPSTAERNWRPGKYTDEQIEGSGLVAAVRITVDDNGKVKIAFQGKRDDKGFMIHLHGEVDAHNGKFVAIGSRGPHNARLAGRFEDGHVEGSIQGSIHQRGYRVNFKALDPSQSADESDIVVEERALQDRDVRGIDIGNPAHLRLKVSADGTVVGGLLGKREGKGFSIAMRGKMNQNGEVEATGSRGPNTVRLSGRSVSDGIEGTLQGTIYLFDYDVKFTAK